jgi:HlyD family secretion protein
MSPFRVRELIASACVSAALVGCSGPNAAEKPQPATPGAEAGGVERVTTGSPQRKDLTLTTTQPASIEAYEATPLSPKLSGYVREVLVDIGDPVKTGQVLLRLDAPEMFDELRQKQALLKQAEAEVGQAQAGIVAADAALTASRAGIAQAEAVLLRAESALAQYKSEAMRIEKLAASKSVTEQVADESRARLSAAEAGRQEAQAGIEAARAAVVESESDVVQAKADLTAAEARLQVAAANLAFAQTMLGYLELKAPYDGVVTQRNADTGLYVQESKQASAPLLAVVRTDELRVFVDVPEAEAAYVTAGSEGDAAVVTVQALRGRQFNANVTRTSWALDPSNRSLRVEIDLPNDEGVLRPGMYATASIVLEKRVNALTIPTTAVVRDGEQTLVCVVRDGKIARTPVQLGLRVVDDVEVLSGLSETDAVVLLRADALKDGQKIEVSSPPRP